MNKTPFAGLTRLDADDPLSTDGFSFQALNPLIIDRLLKLGAVTHRHDAHGTLQDPTDATVAELTPTGVLEADTTYAFCYTLVDADGGETLPSPVAAVTTDPALGPPNVLPDFDVDPTAGRLPAGTYTYGLTLTDASGETTLGPTFAIAVDPGSDTNSILLTGLSDMVASSPGATGWRLYKANSSGKMLFVAAGGAAMDSVTDDGTLCADCAGTPPTTSTTSVAAGVTLTIPATVTNEQDGIAAVRLYAAVDGIFVSPSLLDERPASDVGQAIDYTLLTVEPGAPPDVSTSVPGASKIDPDTELLDWHWKRPVATIADLPAPSEAGDIRVVIADGSLHVYGGDDEWHPFTAAAAFWQPPVATAADLPADGNTVGDVRLVLADDTLHAWGSDAAWHAIAGAASGGGGGGTGVTTTLALGEKIEWQDDAGNPWGDLWTVKNLVPVGRVNDDYTTQPDGALLDQQWNGGAPFRVTGGHLVPNPGTPANTYYRATTIGAAIEWQVSGSFRFLDDNWTLNAVGVYNGPVDGYELAAFHDHIELRHQIGGGGWVTDRSWPLATPPVGGVYLEIDRSGDQLTIYAGDDNGTLIDNVLVAVPAAFLTMYSAAGFAGQWAQGASFALDYFTQNLVTYTYEVKASVGKEGFAEYAEATLVSDAPRTDGWSANALTSVGDGWAQSGFVYRIKDGVFDLRGQFVKITGDPPVADEVMCTLDNNQLGLAAPFSFQVPQQLGFPPFLVGSYDLDGNHTVGLIRLNDEGDGTLTLRWMSGQSSDPATKEPAVDLTPVHWYI